MYAASTSAVLLLLHTLEKHVALCAPCSVGWIIFPKARLLRKPPSVSGALHLFIFIFIFPGISYPSYAVSMRLDSLQSLKLPASSQPDDSQPLDNLVILSLPTPPHQEKGRPHQTEESIARKEERVKRIIAECTFPYFNWTRAESSLTNVHPISRWRSTSPLVASPAAFHHH